MKNPFRPISISLSPNTEKDDVRLAKQLLFQPGKWIKGEAAFQLEKAFGDYLGSENAVSFNSGRSALLAILKSLELNSGDEILLQAFTCNAAVNPIIWAGLKPVFVDCEEETFNLFPEDLQRKINDRSKAVIIQHTFGQPAETEKILEICRQNNLILIEDCAHALGAEISFAGEMKKVGTFGRASFFSFSRDKVISSVYGGMAVTNDDNLAQKIRKYQRSIGYSSSGWVFQQLLHPILMNKLILPLYGIGGKYLLLLFQQFHLLSKAVHWKEKRGRQPGYFPRAMPNALAILALNQLLKLERFNLHRQKIADFYFRELKDSPFELPFVREGTKPVFLRFIVRTPEAKRIIKQAWAKNLLIGDWYTSPVAPDDTQLNKVGYVLGSCPVAEKLAQETMNLPTHINISETDAQKIINFLKSLSTP